MMALLYGAGGKLVRCAPNRAPAPHGDADDTAREIAQTRKVQYNPSDLHDACKRPGLRALLRSGSRADNVTPSPDLMRGHALWLLFLFAFFFRFMCHLLELQTAASARSLNSALCPGSPFPRPRPCIYLGGHEGAPYTVTSPATVITSSRPPHSALHSFQDFVSATRCELSPPSTGPRRDSGSPGPGQSPGAASGG